MPEPSPLLPLPERARLMHIGTMKSGTNSIQHAAKKNRRALLTHGVRYPGSGVNHFTPVCAFMGLSREGQVPPMERWQRLMNEVDGDRSRRILLSHEWICEADDEMAQRFIDAVGDRTHVAITLRPLSGMLGSYWQQMVKTGVATLPFDQWLEKVLATAPGEERSSQFDRQSDQAGIVERWERLLGPDRVTVLIADKNRPTLLSSSFERLLGLPEGMLEDTEATGGQSNRSLSAPEAELFRRLNVVFKEHKIPWVEYATAYRRGAVARVLQDELPGSDDKILLQDWAAERVTAYSKTIVERLRQSKVTVVGDLETLQAPVSQTRSGEAPVIDMIPMDVAVEAIVGTVSAGSGRGPFLGPKKKRDAASPSSPTPPAKAGVARLRRLPFANSVVDLGRRWFRRG